MQLTYGDLAERLTPEARSLFIEMVEVHLSATKDREFALAGTMSGWRIHFWGDSDWVQTDPDRGALNDLVGYGLIRISGYRSRGDPRYEIPGEGVLFYRFLMEQSGQPVEQVEDAAVRHVDGQGFARRHRSAAEHIAEALKLQRSDRLTVPVITEIGSHLRAAVFEVAAGVTGNDVDREKPIPALNAAIEASGLQDREKAVVTRLVLLVGAVLYEAQRLDHVRNEVDIGEPQPLPDEVRRAVYTTVFALAELDRAMG